MAPASQVDLGESERWTTTSAPDDDLKLDDVDDTCRFPDQMELMDSLLFDDGDSSSTISDDRLMAIMFHDDKLFESSYGKNTSKKRRHRDDDGAPLPAMKKPFKDSAYDTGNGKDIDRTVIIPPLPRPKVRRSWKQPVCTFLNFFGTRRYQEMESNVEAASTSTTKEATVVPTPTPSPSLQVRPQQQRQQRSLPPPLTGNPTPNFLFPVCPCKLKHQVNTPNAVAPPILKLLSSTAINVVCQPIKPILCQSATTLDDDSKDADDDEDKTTSTSTADESESI